MVEDRTSLDRINTKRTILYIRNSIEKVLQYYLFETKDSVTEDNIRKTIKPFVDSVSGCKLLAKRSERRNDMAGVDRIIDIIEEEIEFTGCKGFYLDLAFTPPKSSENIQINFRIK